MSDQSAAPADCSGPARASQDLRPGAAGPMAHVRHDAAVSKRPDREVRMITPSPQRLATKAHLIGHNGRSSLDFLTYPRPFTIENAAVSGLYLRL